MNNYHILPDDIDQLFSCSRPIGYNWRSYLCITAQPLLFIVPLLIPSLCAQIRAYTLWRDFAFWGQSHKYVEQSELCAT